MAKAQQIPRGYCREGPCGWDEAQQRCIAKPCLRPQTPIVRTGLADPYMATIGAIRARADELRISRVNLENACGLPEGYTGQLLSPLPNKRMRGDTLLRMLDLLEFDVVLLPRPGAAERVLNRFGVRDDSQVRNRNIRTALRKAKKQRLERLFNDPRYFRKLGRLGGRATAKSLSPKARQLSALRAIRARWRQRRKRKIEDAVQTHEPPTEAADCAALQSAGALTSKNDAVHSARGSSSPQAQRLQ